MKALNQSIQDIYIKLSRSAVQTQLYYDFYLEDLKMRYQGRLAKFEHQYDVEENSSDDILPTHWMIAPWSDSLWKRFTSKSDGPIPAGIRLGRFKFPDGNELIDTPVFVPLIGQGHIFIEGYDQQNVQEIIETLLLRMLVSFPSDTVRMTLCDPLSLGKNLSGFLKLPPKLRGEKVNSRPDEIANELIRLENHIEQVTQDRLGKIYSNIEEYNENVQDTPVPYHILALMDFPAGFDEAMLLRLEKISRNGPVTGVYIFAGLDNKQSFPREFNKKQIFLTGLKLKCNEKWEIKLEHPDLGSINTIADRLPNIPLFLQLLEQVKVGIENVSHTVPLSRIAISANKTWAGSTVNGIYIPIGIDEQGKIHQIILGQDTVHHALVGGRIGSGKTNFLHVLINQAGLLYSPEELELYLMDLKEGVEFQDYQQLPHAKVIALETDPEYGLSLLNHIHLEFQKRGKLFTQAKFSEISEYRKNTGKSLPRILLIIDEYQKLFDRDNSLAQEASYILEDLTRRGRSFGIHIVLSSQSPSAQGLYSGALYTQIGLRIAFQCMDKDSQAILGESNLGATQIQERGLAIFNDCVGMQSANKLIRVASGSKNERSAYLKRIVNHVPSLSCPLTFNGSEPARMINSPSLMSLLARTDWREEGVSSVNLWLGEPVAIKPETKAFLKKDSRCNFMIMGGKESQAYGLLLSTFVSLISQIDPQKLKLIIAEFEQTDSPYNHFFSRVTGYLPHMSIDVANKKNAVEHLDFLLSILNHRMGNQEVVSDDLPLGDSWKTLDEVEFDGNHDIKESDANSSISNIVSDDTTCVFIICGLQRWRELRGNRNDYDPNTYASKLLSLAEDGPEHGIHLVIWSDTYGTLSRFQFERALELFDMRVYLRLTDKDSSFLLDNVAASQLGDHRALFRDEGWESGRMEKFKPYVIPENDDLQNIITKINAKQNKG